ncbi:MAG: hypothetical protein ACRC0G_17240 [Fusobacteriaceae bacterium]
MELIHAISQQGISYCNSENDGEHSPYIGLSDRDITILKEMGVVKVIGWYCPGSYEGSGEAIIVFNDGTVKLRGLGHCSCYGPWDDVEETVGQPLEVVRKSVTDNPEYWEQIGHFFNHINVEVEY